MGKFFFAVVAAIASLALVDSLVCNSCPFGLFGKCVKPTNETCATNSSVCFTSTTKFPSVSEFAGFYFHGCKENNTGCEAFNNGTLIVNYETKTTCCSTDNCNTPTSGAPFTKMTFTASIGAALLVSVLGSLL